MALLFETTIGDIVIDLDVDGSPTLCKNVLKLAKARYYTGNLVYNVQPNRFCQLGDPSGDGSGGACIYGVLDAYEDARKRNDEKYPDVINSHRRFLKSDMGRALNGDECRERGRVVATEMDGIADTIGSQLLITIDEGKDRALDSFDVNSNSSNKRNDGAKSTTNDGSMPQKFRSVGIVVEDDDDVLGKLNAVYTDKNGRPYADVRVIRAMVIDDPFDDPEGMEQLLEDRGVTLKRIEEREISGESGNDVMGRCSLRYTALASPDYERPPEERVEIRISADDIDEENATDVDIKKMRFLKEERLKREDKSRAVVLEMLGDLPSANIKAPENVLFVCKLNPVTEDEDLELIFSRFDEKVSVEIVRDHKTGASLQYAFVEFSSKKKATEAFFKMNNALVDDRRIKVDFSQSVSKVWDRFNQRKRRQSSPNYSMPRDPFKEQQQTNSNGKMANDKVLNNERRGIHRRDDPDSDSKYSPSHSQQLRMKEKYNESYRKDDERYRGTNYNKRKSSANKERNESSICRDNHQYQHRDHRDYSRHRHNFHIDPKTLKPRGRKKVEDGNEHFRSRGRPPDDSSTRRSEKNYSYDSYFLENSGEESPTKNRRKNREDRHHRRRSRSWSSSSSRSYVERRDRHRSSHKKMKKKRERRSNDDRRRHKRSRRDGNSRHSDPRDSYTQR